MAGFGSPKRSGKNNRKLSSQKTTTIHPELILKQAINYHLKGDLENAEAAYRFAIDSGLSNAIAFSNLGVICQAKNCTNEAIAFYKKALHVNPTCPDASANLGGLYIDLGDLELALSFTLKSLEHKPDNPDALTNLGIIYKDLGDFEKAIASTLKSLEYKPDDPDALINLGIIYKDLGDLDQALVSILKSLELDPNSSYAHMTLGCIYQILGNFDQALASTIKSLYLDPNFTDAHMNLGIIYKDLGDLDQALASTLKSLELRPNNSGAVNSLKAFIGQLNITPSNAKSLFKAYEILIGQTDVSHKKLSPIFLYVFLPIIQEASTSDPIISDGNNALKVLAADWRFLKSLTLMIPPSAEAEIFFTRLRRELLEQTIHKGTIPSQLKPLAEALAMQCFLNEYVYSSSYEEDGLVIQLIDAAVKSQGFANESLAIIGCYKPIYETEISQEFIDNYPIISDVSKELIMAQFFEPLKEKEIKSLFCDSRNITNKISQRVQGMYEENPYPRFRYSDYTFGHYAQPIFNAIQLEATKKELNFSVPLTSYAATPKVLIAGCGTGAQVINASRYKNAAITAIDISSSSLAYASRKSNEYKMNNVTFKHMDLLSIDETGDLFDVIECGGVLHHMDRPYDGLSALVRQLKPSGYIKLGLYSEIARSVIVEARKVIRQLSVKSTPDGIREFRRKIIHSELMELIALQQRGDFWSLSSCRDLCFHVQEHLFSAETLKMLLDDHGLVFCGFMLSPKVKKLYRSKFPEDCNMTSLSNWGIFEELYPSTFVGMYQFWAQKIS